MRLELWLTGFAFYIINATITQKFWKGSFRKLRSAQYSTWKITFTLYTSRKLWQRRHWQWKILPGNWRPNDGADAMQSVNVIGGNNYTRNCKEIRDRWFFQCNGKTTMARQVHITIKQPSNCVFLEISKVVQNNLQIIFFNKNANQVTFKFI